MLNRELIRKVDALNRKVGTEERQRQKPIWKIHRKTRRTGNIRKLERVGVVEWLAVDQGGIKHEREAEKEGLQCSSSGDEPNRDVLVT